MNITIKNSKKPDKLKRCNFKCDVPLDNKLDNYDLTKFLNCTSTNLFIGRPKSGKTSFIYTLFSDKKLLRNCFENIFVFQPSQSRASMSDPIFDKLDEDKRFNELTYSNLQDVLTRCKEEPEYNHAIIFDDVGAYLRDDIKIRNLLKEILMNKRHYKISVFMLVQSYKSAEPTLRKLFDNFFIWRVTKDELKTIFNEVVESHKGLEDDIIKTVYDKPYNFLFININTQSMFKNWDKLEFQ